MRIRTLSVPLAVLTAAAMLFAGTAEAGAATVTGGNLDWGIKTSFRDYITNRAPNGSITPSGGATTNDDGSFDYRPGSGSYTPGGAVDATFGGKVFFTGHDGILKFTLANPRISYTGDVGILYADVVSSSPFGPDAGKETSYRNVDFATLDLSGVSPVDNGSNLSVAEIPATLTENGYVAFAPDFYPAGTALDPVSFTLGYGPGELNAGKKKVKVAKKGGEIELADVECESASCKVKAPKKISARIKGGKSKGKKVNLKVKVSKERDGDVDVVAVLKRGDAKLLASGGSLMLKAKITLKGDGKPLTEKVNVKVVSR